VDEEVLKVVWEVDEEAREDGTASKGGYPKLPALSFPFP
jgi:hypothetical protein